jgi:AmiR/NasT family two-component response regulator
MKLMSEGDGNRGGNVIALPVRPDRLTALQRENAQLREALETRIVIEQAKGAASARMDIDPDVAFKLLRGLARSQGRDLHDFAAEVIAKRGAIS